MSVSFLARKGAPALAYMSYKGTAALPTIVFLTGFRSDMLGTKAAYLMEYCMSRGQSCLLFDYSGHGQSEGKFEDGTIGSWRDDALAVIDELTDGDIILIGSSMGGWIALLCALARKDRVKGLIGLAAAPDFTLEIPARMDDAQRHDLNTRGYVEVENDYGPPYHITKALIDNGNSLCLLSGVIDLDIPVRLIQGMQDSDVEWQKAHRITNAITGDDKKVYLLEEGDHRLSRPQDLELLGDLVREVSGT